MPWTTPGTYVSLGQTGYLGVFAISTSLSPPSYVAIVNVKSIVPDFATTPPVDISSLQSVGNTQELYPGMIKPGPVELTGNFLADTSQLAIYTLQKAQTIFQWCIQGGIQQYSKTYTAVGLGFVTKYAPGPWENDKALDFKFTIQVTGPVTETLDSPVVITPGT